MQEEKMVLLRQSTLTREVTYEIPRKEPYWPDITERFKGTKVYKRKNYEGSLLASRLGEIALQLALEELASASDGRIQIPLISSGAHTENYRFSYIDDELCIKKRDSEDRLTGIDALILADGLPVIFEMKLGTSMSGEIKKATSNRKIRNKVLPVQEYFGREGCGYILVVFPEIMHRHRFHQFKKRGGVVMPFWMSSRDYRKRVYDLAQLQLWHEGLHGDRYFRPITQPLAFDGAWSERSGKKKSRSALYIATALLHPTLPKSFTLVESR